MRWNRPRRPQRRSLVEDATPCRPNAEVPPRGLLRRSRLRPRRGGLPQFEAPSAKRRRRIGSSTKRTCTPCSVDVGRGPGSDQRSRKSPARYDGSRAGRRSRGGTELMPVHAFLEEAVVDCPSPRIRPTARRCRCPPRGSAPSRRRGARPRRTSSPRPLSTTSPCRYATLQPSPAAAEQNGSVFPPHGR